MSDEILDHLKSTYGETLRTQEEGRVVYELPKSISALYLEEELGSFLAHKEYEISSCESATKIIIHL